MNVGKVGSKPVTATKPAKQVTVQTLREAGGQRYETTPPGRMDAYSSVIALKGKLYSVLTGFGRPARVNPMEKKHEKATLTTMVDIAMAGNKLEQCAPLSADRVKSCRRVDVSHPERAGQVRMLFIDKKSNEMFVNIGSGFGPVSWNKLLPSN